VRNLLGDPAVAGIVANHRDITDRRAYQDRLAHEARHDSLTGLPNRKAFFERLETALARGRRHRTAVALLFVDLDRFKLINDTLGHIAGDQLIVAVAERLRATTRPEDVVSRLSGDEFTILLEDVGDAAEVAERLTAELCRPLEFHGRKLVVTASVGVAVSDASTSSPEDLLRQSDLAMYAAKEGGRARSVVFDPAATPQFVERVELEAGLRSAVERDELRLHYQPIVDATSRQVEGFEALVRWQHPARGMLLPADFVGLAEETGLIDAVGTWVLEEACRALARWQSEMPGRPLMMTVNVSVIQIHRPGFADLVARVIDQAGIPASSLILEMTESVLVDLERTVLVLQELRLLGVRIALDDFGTGYSSLGYLRRLPLDFIKIDRSFVEDLRGVEGDTSIVRAIVDLARSVGLGLIAEGVETEAQARAVAALGCGLAQGFLYSRPQPLDAARSLLCQPPADAVRPIGSMRPVKAATSPSGMGGD
jgi:diguanylate cyclase (GGDEF)-like protein